MPVNPREGAAFEVYVGLGPSRTLRELHTVLRHDPTRAGFKRGPSLRSLETWSARYGWQERIAEAERKAREEAAREHVELLLQHRKRQHEDALHLQERGRTWLGDVDHERIRPADAIKALEVGHRLEGAALGEATERIAVEVTDERLGRLSDDELEALIRLARQGTAAVPDGEGPSPS